MSFRTICQTVAAGCAVPVAIALICHGQDAQERTQTFFDTHKGADPINPNRTLTDKIKQPERPFAESTLPPLTIAREANRKKKEVQELEKQQKNGIAALKQQFIAERKKEKTLSAMEENIVADQAKKAWDASEEGKRINQRLKERKRELLKLQTTGTPTEPQSTLPPLHFRD